MLSYVYGSVIISVSHEPIFCFIISLFLWIIHGNNNIFEISPLMQLFLYYQESQEIGIKPVLVGGGGG